MYTYVYVYVYVCVYVYIYIHMNIYIYTCIHTLICVCMCVYIYIYIYSRPPWERRLRVLQRRTNRGACCACVCLRLLSASEQGFLTRMSLLLKTTTTYTPLHAHLCGSPRDGVCTGHARAASSRNFKPGKRARTLGHRERDVALYIYIYTYVYIYIYILIYN